MGTNPLKENHQFLTKKLLPYAIYALLPLALLRFYFYPITLNQTITKVPQNRPLVISFSSQGKERENEIECDYSNGKWVSDASGPQYSGTSCGTIKDGQNCMAHGRPDTGYLYWRWQPNKCNLPRFDPSTFLRILKNKHIAFIGDSMARNQLESLLCLVSVTSSPTLVYTNGGDNKFRRWHLPSHNISISVYWSPFLVKGIEKSPNSGFNYNKLYLDSVDEKWASELDQMDVVLLSVGHWFLHPAVYFEQDVVVGCHYCPDLNYTEIGFYQVMRKALATSLKAVVDRHEFDEKNVKWVVLTTFSPSHFEGKWDEAGACPRKEPFKEGEKAVEGMDEEMRKIAIDEVAAAEKRRRRRRNGLLHFQALDVTKLAVMRPDGHPGPHMYPFPFANGIKDRVQNDCVHWCLPGPIDAWNEILLQLMINRWEPH